MKKNYVHVLTALAVTASFAIPSLAHAATTPDMTAPTTHSVIEKKHQPPFKIVPLQTVSKNKSSTIIQPMTTTYTYGTQFWLFANQERTGTSEFTLTSGRTVTFSAAWTPTAYGVTVGLYDTKNGTHFATYLSGGNDSSTVVTPTTGSGFYEVWMWNDSPADEYFQSLKYAY